jgi:hypothetical protein
MRPHALAAPALAAAIAAALAAPGTAAAAKGPCGLKGKGLKVIATSPTATIVKRVKVTSPDLDPEYSTTIWGCIGNRKPRVIYNAPTNGGPAITLTGNQVAKSDYGYDSACLKAGFGDGEDCSTGRTITLLDLTTGTTLYTNTKLTNDPLAVALDGQGALAWIEGNLSSTNDYPFGQTIHLLRRGTTEATTVATDGPFAFDTFKFRPNGDLQWWILKGPNTAPAT